VLVETIACAEPIGEKQRYIVGTQKVMKVDRGRAITLDAAQQAQMLDRAAALAAQCDACIVLDYGRGMMSASTLTRLCRAVRPHVDRLVGDVSGRRSNLQSMHEMDLLCPSESELREAMQDYEDGLNAVVWRMLEQSQSASAIVTLGEDGLVAFDQPNARAPRTSVDRLRSHNVQSLSRTCVDRLGCGDALIAAATLAHLHTGDLRTAATLGALAASIEINQLGNVPVSADDLREHLQPTPFDHIEPKAVTSAYPEVTQQTAAQV